MNHACAAGVTVEAGTVLATLELEGELAEQTQVHQGRSAGERSFRVGAPPHCKTYSWQFLRCMA